MKVFSALLVGFVLRFIGWRLVGWGHRIEAWAGVEPIKAGGTD